MCATLMRAFDMELIPIHTMLLPDGQILSYGTSAKGRQGADLYYEVWDWNRGIHGSVHKLLQHKTKADIFCSSLNVDTSNGNIIIMGGDVRNPDAGFGIETVLEYDVKTEIVRRHPKGDMKYARWYGTSVNLPNGDIFVVGGRDDEKRGSPIPEIYSPDTGFRQLKGASIPIIAKETTKNHWWYPHTYVNSHGDLIVIMPRKDNADIYRVDVDGDGAVTRIGRKPFEAHVRSPSIMFRTDQLAFLDDKGALWVADISNSNSVSWEKKNSLGHGRTNGSMALLPKGDMKYARWYGTSVNLPNGDIFVVGGRDDEKRGSPIPEIYSPDTGFRQLKGASIPIIAKETTKNHWWYPHTYVNSHGDLIVIMPRKDNADIYRVDVDGDGAVTRIGRKPFEAHVRSPSIMFRTDQLAFLDDKGALWVADISNSNSVSWEKKNSLGHGRTNGSMALLPDGRVVMVGGARTTDDAGSNLGMAEKSLHYWDPGKNKLVRGDKENNARLYHSSALILPDTSVVSAGGGAPGPVKNRNGQLFHPDYFYDTKQQKVDRSKITESPRNIRSGDSFFVFVDDTSRVVKVTATKSGSSSHTRNCDTRWLNLPFDIVDDTTLRVTAENRNIMIGGLWMLNLIDIHGVPSEAVLMGVDMAAI